MTPKRTLAGLAVSGFLLLVGVAATAAEEQRELEERYARDERQSSVSFKLNAGYLTTRGGDFRSAFETYDKQTLGGAGATGSLAAPGSGFDYEGDMIVHFTRNFGIGFGGGYLRSSKTSNYGLSFGVAPASSRSDDTTKLQLSAIPLRVGLHFFFPLWSRVDLLVNASPAVYLAWAELDDTYHEAGTDKTGAPYTVNSHRVTDVSSSWGYGVEGGLGLNLRVSKMLSFHLEAGGRWADLSSFTGSYMDSFSLVSGNAAPVSDLRSSSKATLYYYEWYDAATKTWIPAVNAGDAVPVSSSSTEVRNSRKAKVDFSGVGARIGLSISF